MNTYLIPADDDIVEAIAKSIAKNRLLRDTEASLNELVKHHVDMTENMSDLIDKIFEALWNGTTEADIAQKQAYKDDALAAIRTINLKLLTSTS